MIFDGAKLSLLLRCCPFTLVIPTEPAAAGEWRDLLSLALTYNLSRSLSPSLTFPIAYLT
jgi:hypothetical protein